MLVRYLEPYDLTVETTGPAAIFLRGPLAWFSIFLNQRETRFEGWFMADPETQPHQLIKLLERIYRVDEQGLELPPVGVSLQDNQATLYYQDQGWLRFQTPAYQPDQKNLTPALAVESSPKVRYQISLDPRGIYQSPEWGRQLWFSSGLLQYEDPLLDFPLYLTFDPSGLDTNLIWNQVYYPRDAARHSDPCNLYVAALPPLSGRINFGAGKSKEAALEGLEIAQALQFQAAAAPERKSNSDKALTQKLAEAWTKKTLAFLETPGGYYAGLPWFHQVWSRDELLLALGLPQDKQKEMIIRYLELPLQEGELPTYLNSGTTCADGVGWLALLIREHGLANFSSAEKAKIQVFLKRAITGLKEHRLRDNGLVYSGHNNTWMDTIGRSGFRIEIQAMYALMHTILAELGDKSWLKARNQFRQNVKAKLILTDPKTGQGELILDGLNDDGSPDPLLRPNLFMAYLLDPELFTHQIWERNFELALEACETSWGGLSSLEHSAQEFKSYSSGQDNQSYHNGDSWFLSNNLAALALHRLNPKVYQAEINTILESSTRETLTQHFLGFSGEIASAADGTSWGTGIHGFSAGPYLKACREIYSQETA